MESLKKLLIAVLIFLTMILYLPRVAFAQQAQLHTKASITEYAPKSRTTHEKDIPMIKKKKTSSWTWMLLVGVIALLAGAAGGKAATSTTGGGTTPATGDVTVGW